MRAFIFPGQGSQFIGMGKDLADAFPVAKETFQKVDDVLGQNLSGLMFDGEEAELNLTENTQPALMAVSMAVMNVLTTQGGISLQDHCAYVAGHSLGEYSALTAASTLDIADTAKLLKLRGQAMQQAVPVGVGSMAAIIGMDLDQVQEIAQEASQADNICEVANDNSVGQIVISGHKEAIEKAVALATEKGAKKAVILPVSAPFHCSLMAPAAKAMKDALAQTDMKAPIVPVVANVTANAQSNPDDLRGLLVDQVTGMVKWRDSVSWMVQQGVTEMVEIGAGKVLNGLVRRIDRNIQCQAIGTVEQIEGYL